MNTPLFLLGGAATVATCFCVNLGLKLGWRHFLKWRLKSRLADGDDQYFAECRELEARLSAMPSYPKSPLRIAGELVYWLALGPILFASFIPAGDRPGWISGSLVGLVGLVAAALLLLAIFLPGQPEHRMTITGRSMSFGIVIVLLLISFQLAQAE